MLGPDGKVDVDGMLRSGLALSTHGQGEGMSPSSVRAFENVPTGKGPWTMQAWMAVAAVQFRNSGSSGFSPQSSLMSQWCFAGSERTSSGESEYKSAKPFPET